MTGAGKHYIDMALLPLDRLVEPVKMSASYADRPVLRSHSAQSL